MIDSPEPANLRTALERILELSEQFEQSRYGVMKHLTVLEAADLIVSISGG